MNKRLIAGGVAVLVLGLLLAAALAKVRSIEYALTASAVVVAVALLVWLVPLVQASTWPDDLVPDRRVELIDKARGTVVQLLGAVGLVATVAITVYQVHATQETSTRTLSLTESSQAAERLAQATEHLGATDSNGQPLREVRIGGLYGLEQYAQRSSSDRQLVGRIVAAYIRGNSRKQTLRDVDLPQVAPCLPATNRVPEDVAAALDVLRDLFPAGHEGDPAPEPPALDLANAGLVGADLRRLDLRAANLTGAQIALAALDSADLDDADLAQVDGRSACFLLGSARRSRFTASGQATSAEFLAAAVDLRGAAFLGVDLTDAELFDADLRNATFDGPIVTRARFGGANLGGVHIKSMRGRGDFPCGGEGSPSCDQMKRYQATDQELSPSSSSSPQP